MNETQNHELLTRSVAAIYPSKEFLEAKLARGEKLTLYLGIDPTGPTLHLGHAIALKKLADFQKAGHKIIMLLGDFTAMIGDPTDKASARKQLTQAEVLENLKLYKEQARALISFEGENAAEVKFNSTWLGAMNFADVLSLASQMTVSQMLERDMFQKRIEEDKPIYIHEFMYPLMQGYDSVAMDVDGEVGGNDQTFNMLCGRTLMKSISNKEKFVVTVKLLEDNNGKKMGKTEGNMVSLADTAQDMYGKIMSWTDSLIIPGFELCTDVPLSELETVARNIATGEVNPRDLKMRLALDITTLYHGEKNALEAQESFVNTFQKQEIPTDIEVFTVVRTALLIDIITDQKIVTSKTDFRRLVSEGAITNLDTDQKVTDVAAEALPGVYRIGKKRFFKIVHA